MAQKYLNPQMDMRKANRMATIGMDESKVYFKFKGYPVMFKIWDTAG